MPEASSSSFSLAQLRSQAPAAAQARIAPTANKTLFGFTEVAARKLPNFSSVRGIAAKDNGLVIQHL